MKLNIFPWAYSTSVHIPWKNVYLGSIHFFKIGMYVILALSDKKSSLYILHINHLCIASFANVSHFLCYLFVLFMVSLAVQKFLSLIMPICYFLL